MSPMTRPTLLLLSLGLLVTLAVACGQPIAGDARPAANVAANPSAKQTSSRATRPTRPSTSRPRTTRPSSPDRLSGLAGTWEGEYTCAQGATGLKLIISEPDGTSLPAVFEFFPLPQNPGAKAGSYSMLGTLNPNGQLVFKQQQWINQPPGYVMVDIAVTSPIEESTTQLSGDVLDSACKGFSVRRR
jgi:hypothetical protein